MRLKKVVEKKKSHAELFQRQKARCSTHLYNIIYLERDSSWLYGPALLVNRDLIPIYLVSFLIPICLDTSFVAFALESRQKAL